MNCRLLNFTLVFLCILVFSSCAFAVFSCASSSSGVSSSSSISLSSSSLQKNSSKNSKNNKNSKKNMAHVRDAVSLSLNEYLDLCSDEQVFSEDEIDEIVFSVAQKSRFCTTDDEDVWCEEFKNEVYQILQSELENYCLFHEINFSLFSDFSYDFFSEHSD